MSLMDSRDGEKCETNQVSNAKLVPSFYSVVSCQPLRTKKVKNGPESRKKSCPIFADPLSGQRRVCDQKIFQRDSWMLLNQKKSAQCVFSHTTLVKAAGIQIALSFLSYNLHLWPQTVLI